MMTDDERFAIVVEAVADVLLWRNLNGSLPVIHAKLMASVAEGRERFGLTWDSFEEGMPRMMPHWSAGPSDAHDVVMTGTAGSQFSHYFSVWAVASFRGALLEYAEADGSLLYHSRGDAEQVASVLAACADDGVPAAYFAAGRGLPVDEVVAAWRAGTPTEYLRASA